MANETAEMLFHIGVVDELNIGFSLRFGSVRLTAHGLALHSKACFSSDLCAGRVKPLQNRMTRCTRLVQHFDDGHSAWLMPSR